MPLSGLAFLDHDGKIPAAALPPSGNGNPLAAWPVGSIYQSTVATSPATLFGGGTWLSLGGYVLVGHLQGDPDFGTPGAMVGAKSRTPVGTNSAPTFSGASGQATSSVSAGTPVGTNSAPAFAGSSVTSQAVSAGTPAGTNSAPTFTGSALATHAHELPFKKASGGTGALSMVAQSIFGSGTSRASESVSAAPTANTTSSAVAMSEAKSAGTPAGTVSAPTFAGSALGTHQHDVTAAGTVSAPTFAGSALAGHQHTLTPAGTVSAPAFSGAAMSIIQPSLVVYQWTRTA